jgi:hypothetical protein
MNTRQINRILGKEIRYLRHLSDHTTEVLSLQGKETLTVAAFLTACDNGYDEQDLLGFPDPRIVGFGIKEFIDVKSSVLSDLSPAHPHGYRCLRWERSYLQPVEGCFVPGVI